MKNYLFRNLLLFGAFMMCSFIQAQSISGTISDATGPLPGANVVVKGTSNGTTTDFDGNYKLNNIGTNATLIVSYLGYITQEIKAEGKSVVNLKLESSSAKLDEVVVVAYGTSKKKDLTGAVGIISGDKLNKIPVSSIDQALQGKVSGVQVTNNSGAPGSSMQVNIRGIGTFGSSTPLYIVDGFPTQDIAYLNANDVSSISVLKDASATALYGMRASNGVVIIETKSGKNGEVTVEINSWLSSNNAPKAIKMLTAQEYVGFANEIKGTADIDASTGTNFFPSQLKNPNSLTNVDWQDAAFNNAIRYGHNFSIRGGNDKAKLAFTAGMLNEEGTVVGSSAKKYTTGLKGDFVITSKLRAKANLKYGYQEAYQTLAPGFNGIAKLYTNLPFLTDATASNYSGTSLAQSNGLYGAFEDSNEASTSVNVIGQALRQSNDNARNTIQGGLGLDYDLLKGLTLKTNLGFTTRNYAGSNFSPTYFLSAKSNDQTTKAQYSLSQNTSKEWLAEAFLNYTKSFGKHKIEALTGYTASKSAYTAMSTTGLGFLSNDLRDMSQAQKITDTRGFASTETLVGALGRLNYNYDSKYYVTATWRNDGIGNRFLIDKSRENFYSVAGGWNIDEESFMDGSIFDVLKLRASWGQTGNAYGVSSFQYLANYSNGTSGTDDSGYIFGTNPTASQGLSPNNLANPNLTWEKQVQTNVGLEGELFNNYLFFTVDYFKKTSSDFLFNKVIPAQSGFTTQAVNAGQVTNKGLEVLVGYRQTKGELTWDASVNFTTIDNNIDKLAGDAEYTLLEESFMPTWATNWTDITRSYVGGNVGTFYGYKSDGIFQTKAEVDALNAKAPGGAYQNAKTTAGDRKFQDLNGDGVITDADRTVIGSPIPKVYGNFNFNAKYKAFDLGIDIYGSFGNDILNYARVEQETAGGFNLGNAYTNVSKDYYNNHWTTTNPSNEYARALVNDVDTKNNRVSDHFVEDGSYVRLRNVKFGYTLPSDLIKKIGMTNCNLYMSFQNLLTITKYSGIDPEIGQIGSNINGGSVNTVQATGIDAGAYPVSKAVTFGVNLQF
ncbi:SusC/RagA family TonB-linked outer membrane protein [Flavobacterium restrictum]|uniref:TonB-dependent receptor n=1 Tax=Flavobacterium restrictum TaxID=2594428 RepID=A0A553EBH3_9FLAO|nr:TonB-dependent receptor [Flavobacterium restrictum]TRX42396.1 TonB-dependent receptor [Flavobacterium restrictum]